MDPLMFAALALVMAGGFGQFTRYTMTGMAMSAIGTGGAVAFAVIHGWPWWATAVFLVAEIFYVAAFISEALIRRRDRLDGVTS